MFIDFCIFSLPVRGRGTGGGVLGGGGATALIEKEGGLFRGAWGGGGVNIFWEAEIPTTLIHPTLSLNI